MGPQYRLKTQIGGDTPIDADGTLAGDLVLVGGVDPTLSGREYPYQYHPGSQAGASYSFRAVEELADQLVAGGLKRIDGDIVGDDRHYVWEPHGEGWSMGDALWEYGAPVSALILNDNSFAVTIRPGSHAGASRTSRCRQALNTSRSTTASAPRQAVGERWDSIAALADGNFTSRVSFRQAMEA